MKNSCGATSVKKANRYAHLVKFTKILLPVLILFLISNNVSAYNNAVSLYILTSENDNVLNILLHNNTDDVIDSAEIIVVGADISNRPIHFACLAAGSIDPHRSITVSCELASSWSWSRIRYLSFFVWDTLGGMRPLKSKLFLNVRDNREIYPLIQNTELD